ncbi:MAG TPA: hypothetical protein IAA19_03245 [Candidatus Olsenella pullistercoris]|uniref:PASTA domain-containing protein n=1 Tax=Candidatus Olsenella pullistercoris TaxID=2838712 RepID=A0A9D2EY57_9ACTN|nr:hypothetical protein [Candidatus Olsenella pullistercoris]
MAAALSRRSFLGLCGGALAACAVGCDGAETVSATVETEWGDMPNVVGMQAQEAWTTLVEVGFLPRFERSDDEGEPGTVVSLEAREVPDAVSSILDANGEIHEEYDDASWMASAVCGLCSMNQIPLQLTLGYSEAEARAQLEEAGIAEVEVSYVGDVDETANVVTEVAPLCGAWVMDGESVTITVTSDVTMPNVQGADLFTAQMRLMELGLEPEPFTTGISGANGLTPTVESASVEAGMPLRVGDVVELTYTTVP